MSLSLLTMHYLSQCRRSFFFPYSTEHMMDKIFCIKGQGLFQKKTNDCSIKIWYHTCDYDIIRSKYFNFLPGKVDKAMLNLIK